MSFAHLSMLADTAKLNRTPKDYQVGVRISTLDAAVAEFKRITDAASAPRRCECCGEPDTYRIPVERDTPAYTALRIAGINRIIEADEEANAFLFGGAK